MIVLYATSSHVAEAAAAVRSLAERDLRLVDTPDALLDSASRAQAVVLFLDELGAPECRRLIHEVQQQAAFPGLVIVTPYSRGNTRALKDVIVDDVVWVEEVAENLPTAIDRVAAKSTGSRFGRAAVQHAALRPRVAATLRTAASADPPWRSPDAIAREAVCSLRTLESEFRAAFGPGNRTIMRYLAIARLLWAADRLRAGTRRHTVAQLLGVDVRTLERSAPRLLGLRLHELETAAPADLLARALAAWDAAAVGTAES